VLAIDPGTRELGFAHFVNADLWDYGVKQIRDHPGPKAMLLKVETIINRLVTEKRPDALVLEKDRFSQIRQNARLTLAVMRIHTVARRHGIRVFEYDPRTIRKVVCRNGNATKRELARTVAVRFPEMAQYLHQDRRWKERYHQSSFDAVACGLTYLAMDSTFSQTSAQKTS
jgi:Holliday junction resolvasome RuvABC endonuclease subunit